jgi:WD40 repeat protein
MKEVFANERPEVFPQIGHTKSVTSVAISADGRYALSGSKDRTLKLWDIRSGREVRTFRGHTGTVRSVAISADGRYALSGSKDRTLKLWDIRSGREVRTFEGHTDTVSSITFSPDGRYALSGSYDGTVRLWDVNTGKEIVQFTGFTDGEWVVITPEGYFNASPNGAKHLNVRVGNDVYSIDNFYETFFNPAYVASAIQGKGILTPPDVQIVSRAITVTVYARDRGGGVDEIRLYHNEKAVGEDQRGEEVVSKSGPADGKQEGMIKSYTVTLVDGINSFRAVGYSKDRTESNPYELTVKLTGREDTGSH